MGARVAIIGAGLVGLSTAFQLDKLSSSVEITVFEKEGSPARHQSGRNSGVVHSGVYYQPGSVKAQTCRRGKAMLEAFCLDHEIRLELPGKLIAATGPDQLDRLDDLLARGLENGVAVDRISGGEARRIEPKVAALAALWIPETGIVDYTEVARALAGELIERGHNLQFHTRIDGLESDSGWVTLLAGEERYQFDFLINCGGLHSDRIAKWDVGTRGIRIVPFKGQYYRLTDPRRFLRGAAVYPVPDARFPFLGVHLTPTLEGEVLCGPNAVLALDREGYSGRAIDLRELAGMVLNPGFLRLAARYWRRGLAEIWRSLSAARFAAAVAELIPGVSRRDLEPAPAGIRAQALDRSGELVDDFVFREGPAALHVLNAPSPAATACLAIGETIAERVVAVLEGK